MTNQFQKTLFSLLLLSASLTACAEKPPVPANWKSDCVGRQQVSFPEEVEVAVTPKAFLDVELGIDKRDLVNVPHFAFKNMEPAVFSEISGIGMPFVSETLDAQSIKLYLNAMIDSIKIRQKNIDESQDEYKVKVSLVKNTPNTVVALQMGNVYDVISVLDNRVVLWHVGSNAKVLDESATEFKNKQRSIIARNLHEIPNATGLCLPYIFLKDVDDQSRSITTTYRLKSHPEITIVLRDNHAASLGKDTTPLAAAEADTNDYWDNERNYYRQVGSLWSYPIKRSIHLSAGDGIQTFVALRKPIPNNPKAYIEDLGYLAIVRNDASQHPNAADILLAIHQDTAYANQHHIQPLSQDAFLEMAQTIAASIKPHPTQ